MKYEIELTTMNDVQEFNKIVTQIEGDVRLRGKDEHGANWELSAKSMLCVLLLDYYGMPKDENVFFTGTSPDYQWLYKQMIQELQLRRVNYEDLLNMNLRHVFLIINRFLKEGTELDIFEALNMPKTFDEATYLLANMISS